MDICFARMFLHILYVQENYLLLHRGGNVFTSVGRWFVCLSLTRLLKTLCMNVLEFCGGQFQKRLLYYFVYR